MLVLFLRGNTGLLEHGTYCKRLATSVRSFFRSLKNLGMVFSKRVFVSDFPRTVLRTLYGLFAVFRWVFLVCSGVFRCVFLVCSGGYFVRIQVGISCVFRCVFLVCSGVYFLWGPRTRGPTPHHIGSYIP